MGRFIGSRGAGRAAGSSACREGDPDEEGASGRGVAGVPVPEAVPGVAPCLGGGGEEGALGALGDAAGGEEPAAGEPVPRDGAAGVVTPPDGADAPELPPTGADAGTEGLEGEPVRFEGVDARWEAPSAGRSMRRPSTRSMEPGPEVIH